MRAYPGKENIWNWFRVSKSSTLPSSSMRCSMAPTISIIKQPYSHVQKVVIRSTSVHRIIDANLFGILLGYIKKWGYLRRCILSLRSITERHIFIPKNIYKYGEIFSLIGYSPSRNYLFFIWNHSFWFDVEFNVPITKLDSG